MQFQLNAKPTLRFKGISGLCAQIYDVLAVGVANTTDSSIEKLRNLTSSFMPLISCEVKRMIL